MANFSAQDNQGIALAVQSSMKLTLPQVLTYPVNVTVHFRLTEPYAADHQKLWAIEALAKERFNRPVL